MANLVRGLCCKIVVIPAKRGRYNRRVLTFTGFHVTISGMKPYEYLEHTADMGLQVTGDTLPRLFANAAQGLFETIAVVDTVDETESVHIHLTAESVEELFVAWLDELIFLHETEELFFKRANLRRCSKTELAADVYGESANFDKHEVYTEIKSVTYHQLQVVQKADGSWFAQVIFDL